jgi:hypothetical protein
MTQPSHDGRILRRHVRIDEEMHHLELAQVCQGPFSQLSLHQSAPEDFMVIWDRGKKEWEECKKDSTWTRREKER